MSEITITIKDTELNTEATIVIPEHLRLRFYEIVGLQPGDSLEEAGYVLINMMKEVATQNVVKQFDVAKYQRLAQLDANFDEIEINI